MVTKEQAMNLHFFKDDQGHRWRANGKCHVWVRSPERFKLPVKFGLYDYTYITELNAHHYHVMEVN
jgi:hypothetical protein